MYKSIAVVMFLVISSLASAQVEKYKDTVPSEVLKLYHKDIVSGSRPKVVTVTQTMIQSLVKESERGGDVYRFNFDVSDLSAFEKNILLGWIKNGQKIILWGSEDIWKYAPLFSDKIKVSGRKGLEVTLANHPVNTDVKDITFKDKGNAYVYLSGCPVGTEIIACVKEDILSGRVPYGQGSIYFAGLGEYWDSGKDKDRWTLNFYQWMLGLSVPGSAGTLF